VPFWNLALDITSHCGDANSLGATLSDELAMRQSKFTRSFLCVSTVTALFACSGTGTGTSSPQSGGAIGMGSAKVPEAGATSPGSGGSTGGTTGESSGLIGGSANGNTSTAIANIGGGINSGTSAVSSGGTKAATSVAASGGTNSGTTAVSSGGTRVGTSAVGNGGSSATATATATGGKATGGSTSAAGGNTASTGGGTSTATCKEATCGSHKWACWKVPTPPSENLQNPQSYTDLGNGAVRDNVTCLVWEKANPASQGTWQASVERCTALATSAYAGFSDWRMPTRMEMASLINPTLGSKAFASIFTTTTIGYYATGSWWYETITGQSTAGYHWGYGANGFTSNAVVMTGTNLVARCVRGNGTGEAADVLAVEPPNHYTIGTGEVTDNYTGLVWQQGYSPTLLAWADAPAYCSSLTLNGHTGFRLPTLGELSSTVNEAKVGGAVVAAAFPNNPNGCKDPKYWFWAAESYSSTADWGLSYCDGFTGYNVGASGTWNYFPTANVRCVRNGP